MEQIQLYTINWRDYKLHAMFADLAKFQATLKNYPPVPMGAGDPYKPGAEK